MIKQKVDEQTDQEIKLQTLRRQRSQVERDLAASKMEEPSIALRSKTQVEQVSRQISELREGMAQRRSCALGRQAAPPRRTGQAPAACRPR